MWTFLGILPALLKLAQTLADYFKDVAARNRARKEVAGELAIESQKDDYAVSEVMAEPRTPDDVAERMRDGKF